MEKVNPEKLVRVYVPITESTREGVAGEFLWAEDLGNCHYRIDNSPFSAFGFSLDDVVMAHPKDAILTVSGIVRRGKHSTYRVRLTPNLNHSDFLLAWRPLEKFGCTYEGTGEPDLIYAIDVPPHTDISEIYSLLEHYERAKIWHFEEAHYFDRTKHPNH